MDTRRRRVIQGLIAGCFIAAILVFSRANTLFTRFRLQLTDIYFVPSPVNDTLIIVALDNASFQKYGRSPSQWSRTVYADLIAFLDAAGARVAAFDILFSEQTTYDETLALAIRNARQSDTRLRTVIAAAGVPPAAPVVDPASNAHAIRFERTVEPTSTLSDVADYLGYVNTFPDVDGSVRRQPTLIQTEDNLAVSWSLATYLAYLRIPGAALPQVLSADEHALQIAQTRTV